MQSDRHVIRYTTHSGDRYLHTREPLPYRAAIDHWQELDAARRSGALRWVRHFEVRHVDDPTNPDTYVPTRRQRVTGPKRSQDHPGYLRLSVALHPGQYAAHTFQCIECGRAIEGAGFAVGSHNRHCPGGPDAQRLWQQLEGELSRTS
jgi:hypothetical protein